MTLEVKIDGMMCPHCEMHMKEAFEKLDGVISALCDHKQKKATLEVKQVIDKQVLKNTIKEAGYTYIE